MSTYLRLFALSGMFCACLLWHATSVSQELLNEEWHVSKSTPSVTLPGIVDPTIQSYLDEQLSHGGYIYRGSTLVDRVGTLNAGDGVTVIYINGMFTDRDSFLVNLSELTSFLDRYLPSANYNLGFYNVSGRQEAVDLGKLVCPAVAAKQTYIQNQAVVDYCEQQLVLNGNRDDMIDVFNQYFPDRYARWSEESYVDQETVNNFKATLLQTLNAGQRVIIVAHSQGNFYARDGLKALVEDTIGQRYDASVGLLMLGSPVHPIEIPQGIQSEYFGNCRDIIPSLSFVWKFGKYPVGNEPSGSTPCYPSERNLDVHGFEEHAFVEDYLKDFSRPFIALSLRNMSKSLRPPHETFEIDDIVITNDSLNVRSLRVVSAATKLFTASPGSVGTITGAGQAENSYFWYRVCFSEGCGYVASDWLQLHLSNGPNEYENAQYPTLARDLQILEPAPSGLLAVVGGINLPTPDADDYVRGLGGCTNCSTTAPGRFELYEATISCQNDEPKVKLRWTPSDGREKYHVFRDGGVLLGERTYTTYTDHDGLVPGEVFKYFIKAINGDGSRNSDNAWRVEIPHTICGAPEPPPPYDGPVPVISTSIPLEVEMTTATVDSTVNANELCTSVYFEYGNSPAMGETTNPYAIGCGSGDLPFSRSIPIQCDETVHYRIAASHQFGVEYGNTMTFDAPQCASEAPSNLAMTHDPQNDAIILSWDEPVLPTSTILDIKLKIIADPRPDVETGVWLTRPYQSPSVGKWHDTWLSPQPGGEYCYRVRTWNTAAQSGGYSSYSNQKCMTIEGVFVPQVNFPGAIEVRITLDQGLTLMATGGDGEFEVHRNVNSGPFELIATVQSGNINFLDTDVIPGNTYCYRFVQNGVVSSEYCKTYLTVDQIGTPTVLSLARIDDTWVEVQFTSAVAQEGYFKIWNNYHMQGWIAGGGTAVYTGSDPLLKDMVSEAAYPACIKVEQYLNGTSTGFSNTLCLPVNETQIHYVPPAPPLAPTDLYVNGTANPTNLKHTPILFDAVFNDNNETDVGIDYQVQVSYNANDWNSLLWDSGRTQLETTVANGTRSSRAPYGGPIPSINTPLYWRIRFFDEVGSAGEWSSENATFSLDSYDPSLIGSWSMNGRVGTVGKMSNNVPWGAHSIVEYGNVDDPPGYDGAQDGSYRLTQGQLLQFGELFTPGSNPFSISIEVANAIVNWGQQEIVHAYVPGIESYISIAIRKVNCCVAKPVVTLRDPQGNIVSYSDGPNFSRYPFRRIDVNFYNNPNAMIEIYVDGVRRSTWPVFSNGPYNFNQNMQWLIGGAKSVGGPGYHSLLYGDVDEFQIYNRIRTESEIQEAYLYSRQ